MYIYNYTKQLNKQTGRKGNYIILQITINQVVIYILIILIILLIIHQNR